MTRVVITSDLHLGITTAEEIEPLIPMIAEEQPDLTVIAGDIGKRLGDINACLAMFKGIPGDLAALAGNHDVWMHGDDHSAILWERGIPEAVRRAGALWLEEASWRRDGLAVAGSIAWYDYTGADPSIPPQTENYWMDLKRRLHPDARYLDWPWSDIDFATRCGDALMDRAAALDADPKVTDLLLITHVPIFREQIVNRTEIPNWGYGNAFFGNLTLGERVRRLGKLRAVVSGHTHIGRRVTLADERATPAWVVPSDFHAPRFVVYEHPSGALREQGE
ncbi:MAG TPA: metallophosphoesterase [Ktedonobacterales bacterium]|nr:metallophosphoesterase [Ktedonobacterales bacterium]